MVIIFASSYISYNFFIQVSPLEYFKNHPQSLYIAFIIIISFYFFDLYYTIKDFRRYRQIINLILAISVSFIFIWFLSYFDKSFTIGRRALGIFCLLVFIASSLVRMIFSFLGQKYFVRNALIIGGTRIADILVARLENPKEEKEEHKFGIHLVGYLSSKENAAMEKFIPRLGDIFDLSIVRILQ